MFLCHSYYADGYGVICTNKCEHYLTCVKPKIPLLIHAVSIECSIRGTSHVDTVHASCIIIESVQPDAYINDLVYRGTEYHEKDLQHITCSKPGCSNTILVLLSQWNFFYDVYHRKYKRMMLPYCCKGCQEEHSSALVPGKSMMFVSNDCISIRKKHTYAYVFDNPLQASV